MSVLSPASHVSSGHMVLDKSGKPWPSLEVCGQGLSPKIRHGAWDRAGQVRAPSHPHHWGLIFLELLSERDGKATARSPCTHLPPAFSWWAPAVAFVPGISQQALRVLIDQEITSGMPLLHGTSAVASGDACTISPILSFLRWPQAKVSLCQGGKQSFVLYPSACGSHARFFSSPCPPTKSKDYMILLGQLFRDEH